jgi:hypothetical protein
MYEVYIVMFCTLNLSARRLACRAPAIAVDAGVPENVERSRAPRNCPVIVVGL